MKLSDQTLAAALAESFGPLFAFSPAPTPGKQALALNLLRERGSATVIEIQEAIRSTDTRKIMTRLKRAGQLAPTTYETGTGGQRIARYHYKHKES